MGDPLQTAHKSTPVFDYPLLVVFEAIGSVANLFVSNLICFLYLFVRNPFEPGYVFFVVLGGSTQPEGTYNKGAQPLPPNFNRDHINTYYNMYVYIYIYLFIYLYIL